MRDTKPTEGPTPWRVLASLSVDKNRQNKNIQIDPWWNFIDAYREIYSNSQLHQSKNNLTHDDFKHYRISLSSSVLAKATVSNELTGYRWNFQQAMLDLERSIETVLSVVSMCLLSNSSCVQRTYVGLWRPNKHWECWFSYLKPWCRGNTAILPAIILRQENIRRRYY